MPGKGIPLHLFKDYVARMAMIKSATNPISVIDTNPGNDLDTIAKANLIRDFFPKQVKGIKKLQTQFRVKRSAAKVKQAKRAKEGKKAIQSFKTNPKRFMKAANKKFSF
jgi:hypothetical protein